MTDVVFWVLLTSVAFSTVISFVSTKHPPLFIRPPIYKDSKYYTEKNWPNCYLCVWGGGQARDASEDLAMGTEKSCVLNTDRHERLGDLNILGFRSADSLRRNGGWFFLKWPDMRNLGFLLFMPDNKHWPWTLDKLFLIQTTFLNLKLEVPDLHEPFKP